MNISVSADPKLIKAAAPSREIESSMAELVYGQLQDEVPELFDKLLGFQLIDTKDEGKKDLGMLAFNIYGKHYYMPVFFINGFLKPFVMLFDVDKKQFLPATSAMIRYITRPKPNMNVRLVNKDQYRDVYSNPNLTRYTISPVLSKVSSLDKPVFKIVKDAIDRSVVYKWEPKFTKFLKKASNELKIKFARELKRHPELFEKVALTYEDLFDSLKKTAAKRKEDKKVELKVKATPSPKNSAEENEKIYNSGYAVVDHRKITASITPIELNAEGAAYGAPLRNGIQSILVSGGHWRDMLCLISPHYISESERYPRIILVDMDTLKATEADPNEVFSRYRNYHWGEIWEKTIPISDAESDKEYIALTGDAEYRWQGFCTVPFRVHNKIINSHGLVSMSVCTKDGDFKIIVMPRGTNGFDIVRPDKELLVTPDVRLLPVKIDSCNPDLGSYEELKGRLHNQGVKYLHMDMSPVTKEYQISNEKGLVEKTASYRDMMVHLIVDENLTEKDAKQVVEKRGGYYILNPYRVKEATSVMTYDEPYYEIDTNILPATNYQPPVEHVETNPLIPQSSRSARRMGSADDIFHPMPRTPEMDMSVALSAAQTGQQEVLDSSLLGVLSKGESDIERIKEMLPNLIKSTHNLGILMFSLWWNTDEYLDEFATDELYDLEQSVLDTFKKLGDITLELIQRKKLYSDSTMGV